MAAAQENVVHDTGWGGASVRSITPRLKNSDECPVIPLGIQGKKLVFIDRNRQLCIEPTKCEKNDCVLWFGAEYLHDNYPGKSNSDRWDQRELSEHFVMECADLGPFDPVGKVFGRGAHRAPGGGPELLLHIGRDVLIASPSADHVSESFRLEPAGLVELVEGQRLIFPAASPLPMPSRHKASRKVAEELKADFETFTFVHADIAAHLCLGMSGQMYIGGAFGWRAHMWITAPTGAGKTTIQNLFRSALSDWCLHAEDATEAAIRGVLRNDTLPVLIDEAEGHDSPERSERIINLIKKASAGGKAIRGTVDGGANEFKAQSPFLLSSVLTAPLRGEDRNRMAIIEMRSRPAGVFSEPPDLKQWRERGPALHMRMIAHWHRYDRTYDAYRREIARLGFDDRAQQTYGTLLASADLMLYDSPCDQGDWEGDEMGPDRVAHWAHKCLPLMERSREQAETDDVRARRLLLSTHLPAAAGNPSEPIAVWIDRAMEDMTDGTINMAAREKLLGYGLALVTIRRNPLGEAVGYKRAKPHEFDEAFLAISSQSNRALADLLRGSDWGRGILEQSLARLPGVEYVKVRFAGGPLKALCVPLPVMTFTEGKDADVRPDEENGS